MINPELLLSYLGHFSFCEYPQAYGLGSWADFRAGFFALPKCWLCGPEFPCSSGSCALGLACSVKGSDPLAPPCVFDSQRHA
jgi:hypothetical protein